MKKRAKPPQAATRSRDALEAMCLAVVRRLPGLARVRHVAVIEIAAPEGEPNWHIGEVDISPALSDADRKKVDEAILSWRRRFRLADQEY